MVTIWKINFEIDNDSINQKLKKIIMMSGTKVGLVLLGWKCTF